MTTGPLNVEPPIQIQALKRLSAGKLVALVLVASAVGLAVVLGAVYGTEGGGGSPVLSALPAVNALWNTISATCLVLGYLAIRRRDYKGHVRYMLAALAASVLFLGGYLIYHTFHGETRFLAQGIVRPIYFFTLITHVVLSFFALPLVLASYALALAGKLRIHRKVSYWTLPIWLYVSVTGVAVFVLLKGFNT